MRRARCPFCGPSLIVKLASTAISIRCMRCRASLIHIALAQVLQQHYRDFSQLDVYEMSSRGPVYDFLRRRSPRLVCSEYFDDVAPGSFRDQVQCQDVQNLSYERDAFDLCTSTEVFEHVPDDRQGFSEVCRVLRSGGRFVFTVPLTESAHTVERAVMEHGVVRHMLEPEFHGDAIRGQGRVLAFRNYGLDIVDRLKACGFREAHLVTLDAKAWWGLIQKVVIAEK